MVVEAVLESHNSNDFSGNNQQESKENSNHSCFFQFIFITTIVFNTVISYHGVKYPDWSINLGWLSCLASIVWIPIYMGYRLLYFENGDIIEVLKVPYNKSLAEIESYVFTEG